ncbi:MAG: VOC family protein [Dehalococcoidia bacterium]|nr:VOC family protein [Dehalococcoidia bacterium]
MPTTFRYDHIHLRSRNPVEAAKFYEIMFGGGVTQQPRPVGTPRQVIALPGGPEIYIDSAPEGQTLPEGPAAPHFGLDHFGFGVRELDSAVAELKAKGATFSMEPRRVSPTVYICFVQGPDGVRIELTQHAG